jgi:hypothetical protein
VCVLIIPLLSAVHCPPPCRPLRVGELGLSLGKRKGEFCGNGAIRAPARTYVTNEHGMRTENIRL